MSDGVESVRVAPVADDPVAKYKRLLSMARSSLEANQVSIAAKDNQIQQLLSALEEEKHRNSQSNGSNANNFNNMGSEELHIPRKFLCRVDVDDLIWVLVEYEDMDDTWKCFGNETSLNDFIQRIPGVPFTCPQKCLTVEESIQIADTSKRKLDKIMEEFRRYKVRAEITNKQKDAELKQTLISASPGSSYKQMESQQATSLDKSLRMMNAGLPTLGSERSNQSDEIAALNDQLWAQDTKWRLVCEKIQKENEVLRSTGGEALLATQWRQRYENCLKDKEEINEKLKVYTKLSDDLQSTGVTIEQAYVELQNEFTEFRMKVLTIEQQRLKRAKKVSKGARSSSHEKERERDKRGGEPSEEILDKGDISAVLRSQDLDSLHLYETQKGYINSTALAKHPTMTQPHRNAGDAPVTSIECKIQYVRHMVLKYLTCRDMEVKLGIEAALVAIFRLSDRERGDIENRRREELQQSDTLGAITSFLGEAFSLSTT